MEKKNKKGANNTGGGEQIQSAILQKLAQLEQGTTQGKDEDYENLEEVKTLRNENKDQRKTLQTLFENEDIPVEDRIKQMYDMLIEKTNKKADAEIDNLKVKREYNELVRQKENLQSENTRIANINSKY